MTSTSPSLRTWAAHPVGKVARIAIAIGGTITATLVLMTATVVSSGSWALVLLGVGLAALSVRAARVPTAARLFLLTVAMLAIPFLMQSV